MTTQRQQAEAEKLKAMGINVNLGLGAFDDEDTGHTALASAFANVVRDPIGAVGDLTQAIPSGLSGDAGLDVSSPAPNVLTEDEQNSPLVQQALALGLTPSDIASLRETNLFTRESSIDATALQRLILNQQRIQEQAQQEEEVPDERIGVFNTPDEAQEFINQHGLANHTIGFKPGVGFVPTEVENERKSLETLIAGAIDEGNFDRAVALNNFRNAPSSDQALSLALQFATSPADMFTLSAVARGQLSVGPLGPNEVGVLPRSPLIQQIYERFANEALGNFDFGQLQDEDFSPKPAPSIASRREPAPITRAPEDVPVPLVGRQDFPPVPNLQDLANTFGRDLGGGAPPGELDSQLGFLQPRFDEGFRDPGILSRLSGVPTASPQPVSEPRAPIGQIGESIRPRTAREQEGFVRQLFPAAEPFGGVDVPDELPPIGLPAPVQDPRAPSALPPAPRRRTTGGGTPLTGSQLPSLIPEGTPTGQITFGGQQRDIPVGLQPLFDGGRPIRPPGSLFAALGLPQLSAQAQRNLLPSELAAFTRLAQEAGLPEEEIRRELRATIPAGGRQRRISTAGGGF